MSIFEENNSLLLLFILSSFLSNAQIKELTNKTEEITNLTQVTFFIASLNQTVEDDSYFMLYNNTANLNNTEKRGLILVKRKPYYNSRIYF